MGHDPDLDWDGGYEDMLDSGEDVDSLYLGEYQPYDIQDGHIPARGFETRNELPGRRPSRDAELEAQIESGRIVSTKSSPPVRKKKSQGKASTNAQSTRNEIRTKQQTKKDGPKKRQPTNGIAKVAAAASDTAKASDRSSKTASAPPSTSRRLNSKRTLIDLTVNASGYDRSVVTKVLADVIGESDSNDFNNDQVAKLIRSVYAVVIAHTANEALRVATARLPSGDDLTLALGVHGPPGKKSKKQTRKAWRLTLVAAVCRLPRGDVETIIFDAGSPRAALLNRQLPKTVVNNVHKAYKELLPRRKSTPTARYVDGVKMPRMLSSSNKRVNNVLHENGRTKVSTPREAKRKSIRASSIKWVDESSPTPRPTRPPRSSKKQVADLIPAPKNVPIIEKKPSTPTEVCLACSQPILFGSMCGCS